MLHMTGVLVPGTLDGLMEARGFHWREAHCLDIVPGQHSAGAAEGGAKRG